jgi:hypothetical protein
VIDSTYHAYDVLISDRDEPNNHVYRYKVYHSNKGMNIVYVEMITRLELKLHTLKVNAMASAYDAGSQTLATYLASDNG